MNRLTRATVTLAATATAVLVSGAALPGVALADTSPSTSAPSPGQDSAGQDRLAAIQANAATAIAKRLASLNQAIPAVTNNKAITDADRAALLGTLSGDVSGLTALGQTIAADTTAKQAAADSQRIFTDYRVYALMLPKAHYAAAADDLTGTVLPKLTDAQTRLSALLAGADAGKNTPAVQAAMSDLAAQITAITSATSGLASTVLAYTPAQYNANHDLLSPARASLTTARADAKTARADVATVVKALQ
jgi:hypothetical protein